MKKAIAMKCSQEDWDSIKQHFPKKLNLWNFKMYSYLVNNFNGVINDIENVTDIHKENHNREIHETFNAKIFLEACGIEVEETFKITKEQILDISKTNAVTREKMCFLFPSVFEKDKAELVVGKWYKVKPTNEYLLIFSGNEEQMSYGFMNGKWVYWSFSVNSLQKEAIEATTQEVVQALEKEAFRLGIKNDVWLKDCNGVEMQVRGYFSYCENVMYFGGATIFKDGIWAEIIPTKTLKEAEKELKCKIIS